MALPIFQQPSSISQMSLVRRIFIFLSGLIESAVWGGTILGWPSLVHILKSQGVFGDLCHDSYSYGSNQTLYSSSSSSSNSSYSPSPSPSSSSIMAPDDAPPDIYLVETAPEEELYEEVLIRVGSGCPEQDEAFALVGVVCMALYTTPGFLVGYTLHHLGQVFVRVTSSLIISAGFVMLSLTSKETPNYIWGGSILVSVGGGTLRMACLEFGNLFPKRRNVMIAIISGIYTVSAVLYTLMQTVMEAGYRWDTICQSMAVGSALILATTPFIPRHHIPYTDEDVECDKQEEDGNGEDRVRENPDLPSGESFGTPLTKSVFSISMVLLNFWTMSSVYSLALFSISFNFWVNSFSKTHEEAAYYSKLFGYANLFSVLCSLLPGFAIDFFANLLGRGKTGVEAKVACVQATILPFMFVTASIICQISCFFFLSSWAVYFSLFFLVINRPCVYGVSNPFVRARFPADHFNRLFGIHMTVISVLTALQYPHFTWIQSQYYLAIGVQVGILGLSIMHPLSLLRKSYLYSVFGADRDYDGKL